MKSKDIAELRTLTGFPALVAYLRDELDCPIHPAHVLLNGAAMIRLEQ